MNNEESKGYLSNFLGGFKPEADAESMWKRMEHRFDEKKRRRPFLWWLPLGLLLVGSLTWFGLQSRNETSQVIGNKPVQNELLASKPGSSKEIVSLNNRTEQTGNRDNQTTNSSAVAYSKERMAAKNEAISNSIPVSLHANSPKQKRKIRTQLTQPVRVAPVPELQTQVVSEHRSNQDVSTIDNTLSNTVEEGYKDGYSSNEKPSAKSAQKPEQPNSNTREIQDQNRSAIETAPVNALTSTDHLYVPEQSSKSDLNQPVDSVETDSDSLSKDTPDPEKTNRIGRIDSSNQPKNASRFYLITGPLALIQNAHYNPGDPENTSQFVPVSIGTGYGWSLSLGYQESLTPWLRIGMQATAQFANQNIEYTETATKPPELVVDPATGTLHVTSQNQERKTTSRWIAAPTLNLAGDFHTVNSRYGIRIGGGMLGWYGWGTTESTATSFALRPMLMVQLYARLRDWEFNLGVQQFSLKSGAIPVFEKTESSNLILGFGIGKRF